MIDIAKAIDFVKQYGNAIEIARLESILGNTFDKERILSRIRKFQNVDGGFAIPECRESNISDTGFVLSWLSDLQCPSSDISKHAIHYLESQQNTDGSWREKLNDEIAVPEWKESNNHKAILFQTANTVFWLLKCSGNTGVVEKARAFLKKNFIWGNEYLHTKWLYASILSQEYSWESEEIQGMIRQICEGITEETPPSMKTWMLCSFSTYGMPKDMDFVRKIIEQIPQNRDGSIESEDGDSFMVNATIELVKVYKYYME